MCSSNQLNNSVWKCFCCDCLQWKVSILVAFHTFNATENFFKNHVLLASLENEHIS